MPELNAIGIVVSDMATSIRFYRLLGLDLPDTPEEGHVEASMPGGTRLMLDSEEVLRSFRAGTRSRWPSSARAPPRWTTSTRA